MAEMIALLRQVAPDLLRALALNGVANQFIAAAGQVHDWDRVGLALVAVLAYAVLTLFWVVQWQSGT